MLLMNGTVKVLWFDTHDFLIQVLNNEMLPYILRDSIQDSENLRTIPEHIQNYDKLRHFFADRVLSLSRENAKSILQSLNESQKLSEEQSYQLSLKCRSLSVSDNFWVKSDTEDITFENVNVRKRSLNDSIFQVCVVGTPVSLQHEILAADVSVNGMFKKAWIRESDGLYLYKSDCTADYLNTKAEVAVSEMLNKSSVRHVRYISSEKNGILCSKCKCFTSDDVSFVEAEYVKNWIERKGLNFLNWVQDNFLVDFANMVVCDYLFANPDRHICNWGFLVNNASNEIISMAPMFDNNQALIALKANKETSFDELIYNPTGKQMLQSAIEMYSFSSLNLQNPPDFVIRRLRKLNQLSKIKI